MNHNHTHEAGAHVLASSISGGNMKTVFPLAADLLCDQLDVATIKGVEERKRLRLLRTFLPPDTWAARPTDDLLAAIDRTERAIRYTDETCADIRGAIEKLRTP